jgi:NAD(P)-dependent dehydrogenase (short-subunit alcohol dehydrogenase family)
MDTSGLFSLEDRVALITGGSRGIGKMIAAAYIAQGARVYVSSRKAASCDDTAAELGPNCISLPQNVSTLDGCRELLRKFRERERQLDILVNNAGAVWNAPLEDFPEAGWDKVLNLNLKSAFFLTQAFHPLLAQAASTNRPAKILNVASIDGLRLNHYETYSYHASKAALVYLTKRLAARLIRDHIVVTAIAPGAFPSDLNPSARDDGDRVAKGIPLQRVGTSEDIAGAAIFLASRAGDYVVGSTLVVDGGLVHAVVAENRT